MTNREYLQEHIKEFAGKLKGDGCKIEELILPEIGLECNGLSCKMCDLLVDSWLDAEHKEFQEQEIDWNKLPVDTLLMCRGLEDDEWVLRYYAGAVNNNGDPKVFPHGATSRTNKGIITESYKYNKLAY